MRNEVESRSVKGSQAYVKQIHHFHLLDNSPHSCENPSFV